METVGLIGRTLSRYIYAVSETKPEKSRHGSII